MSDKSCGNCGTGKKDYDKVRCDYFPHADGIILYANDHMARMVAAKCKHYSIAPLELSPGEKAWKEHLKTRGTFGATFPSIYLNGFSAGEKHGRGEMLEKMEAEIHKKQWLVPAIVDILKKFKAEVKDG